MINVSFLYFEWFHDFGLHFKSISVIRHESIEYHDLEERSYVVSRFHQLNRRFNAFHEKDIGGPCSQKKMKRESSSLESVRHAPTFSALGCVGTTLFMSSRRSYDNKRRRLHAKPNHSPSRTQYEMTSSKPISWVGQLALLVLLFAIFDNVKVNGKS